MSAGRRVARRGVHGRRPLVILARDLKGVSIAIPALAILTIATVLTAAPAQAQTYDPNYPVCLQTYGIGGGSIACGYTSLAQCAQSASGRAAQCITNPYFVGAQVPVGAHYRPNRSLAAKTGN
jgi:Protein of unknown function (DUF3551)